MTIVAIPSPADDYDHAHSMSAALASLRAMLTSFDKVMDAVQDTTAEHDARLDRLSERAARCRSLIERMKKLGEEGRPVTIVCPAQYEKALAGLEENIERGRVDVASVAVRAREASSSAVEGVLKADAETDDGLACPSDAWLDRGGSGFDETWACRNAERIHTVPLLGTERLADDNALAYHEQIELWDTRGLDLTDQDAWDDSASVGTATTSLTSLTLSSNVTGRMTASQRRRQLQQQQRGRRAPGGGGAAPDGVPAFTSPSRQQAATGSQPYLCEVLHDSYGRGQPGEFYPVAMDVGELRVFNTSRPSYGNVPSRSSATKLAVTRKAVDSRRSPTENGAASEEEGDDRASPKATVGEGVVSGQNGRNYPLPKLATYRPAVVADDAGRFELPDNLPLSDVARGIAAASSPKVDKKESIAPSRFRL